jgi:RNA polymerase sigma-70 factor (ECF subfamily)
VVGRLPKPRRAARPATAGQFFALACRHLRLELSDRAPRLDKQPQDEREAFDLVRIQGTSPSEAAEVLEVSVRTVNRRLHRGRQLLAATLGDLYPGGEGPAAT